MKASLAIILGLLLMAVVGDIVAPYRNSALDVELVSEAGVARVAAPTIAVPIELRTPATEIRVHPGAEFSYGGSIRVAGTGGHVYAVFGGSEVPTPLISGNSYCASSASPGEWACEIPYRSQNGPLTLVPISVPASINELELVVVKASASAGAPFSSLMTFFAALSVVGAVLLATPLQPQQKAFLLGLAGAGWLILSGGLGGIAMLVLVMSVYPLLRYQQHASTPARLMRVVLIVVSGLVLTKIYPALWEQSFAQQGGPAIAVPLGFAFFGIRALDLVFRIGTADVRLSSWRDFFAYMFFPATLAAGPIYSINEFHASAIQRPTFVDWTAGLARCVVGLVKKTVGDILFARVVVPKLLLLYSGSSSLAAGDIWVLIAANMLYVYLDFSGYSDIAIGIGRQLGWRVPENFNFPLLRPSMRAFWQAWHITLSAWVARWVHFYSAFSLRRSPQAVRSTLSVLTSLLIIGLWHELQLSWFAWGLHHAAGILLGDAVGRLTAKRVAVGKPTLLDPIRYAIGVGFVWLWVSLSHCFTLISDVGVALDVYTRALRFGIF